MTEKANLDTIFLDPDNARSHSARNLEMIEASLDEFGQDQALVVQRSTMQIIKGNGRYLAMLQLGWTEADVLFVDDDDAMAVRRSMADNRSSDTAGWDASRLKALANRANVADWWQPEELARYNIDFDATAFQMPDDDEFEIADEVEYNEDGEPVAAFASGEITEGKTRDERNYHFKFIVSLDESVLIDRALKEAENTEQQLDPRDWLVGMAAAYLQGWDTVDPSSVGAEEKESD